MNKKAPPKVLIVEDDAAIRMMLASYFSQEGYDVFDRSSTEGVVQLVEDNTINLALIDIVLLDGDGLTLTRELRARSEIGIILVTQKHEEVDRIIGLEMGADAYICKPFNTREVLAYAKNIIRRVNHASNSKTITRQKIEFGNWILYVPKRQLFSKLLNTHENLTRDEFTLLHAFLDNPNTVLNRDQLLNLMRGQEWIASDRTIDILVGRLRKKLRDDTSLSEYIVTVYGQGYLFNLHEHNS